MSKCACYPLFGSLCLASIGTGCVNRQSTTNSVIPTDEISFWYDDLGRMHTEANIHDVAKEVIFDTGASGLTIDLSILQEQTLADTLLSEAIIEYLSGGHKFNGKLIDQEINLSFGNSYIHFDNFTTDSIFSRFGVNAIVPIPLNDNHIWNFDYGAQTINIVDTLPKEVVQDCSVKSKISREGSDIFYSLPFSFNNTSGDLVTDINGAMDTGSGCDITTYGGLFTLNDLYTQKYIESCDYFIDNNRNNQYYKVRQTEPYEDNVLIKNVTSSNEAVLVFGNSLLAHYNIWLDLKEGIMYGRVLGNYLSPYCDMLSRNEQDTFRYTSQGLLIEYCQEGSQYWNCGLQKVIS